jgi:hypothetical protein
MKRYLIFSAMCVIMVACSTKVGLTTASTKPASAEEVTWRSTCTKCHGLKDPKLHTASEWIGVVNKMQHQDGEEQFNDETKTQVLKYLQQNASAN